MRQSIHRMRHDVAQTHGPALRHGATPAEALAALDAARARTGATELERLFARTAPDAPVQLVIYRYAWDQSGIRESRTTAGKALRLIRHYARGTTTDEVRFKIGHFGPWLRVAGPMFRPDGDRTPLVSDHRSLSTADVA